MMDTGIILTIAGSTIAVAQTLYFVLRKHVLRTEAQAYAMAFRAARDAGVKRAESQPDAVLFTENGKVVWYNISSKKLPRGFKKYHFARTIGAGGKVFRRSDVTTGGFKASGPKKDLG